MYRKTKRKPSLCKIAENLLRHAVAQPERNYLSTLKKTLKTMPRIAFEIGVTLKGKNLLPLLYFKSRPPGKEAKYLMLMALYYKYFSHACYANA